MTVHAVGWPRRLSISLRGGTVLKPIARGKAIDRGAAESELVQRALINRTLFDLRPVEVAVCQAVVPNVPAPVEIDGTGTMFAQYRMSHIRTCISVRRSIVRLQNGIRQSQGVTD